MNTTTNKTTSIARRHDLDALRAIAMLLGIVLHGAISFIPGMGVFWGVQDTRADQGFAVLLAAIHGWRMPLFFLVSGFFTTMLWRKRGLQALLVHRFKRIFLPMILALFTIIPIVWGVSAYIRTHSDTVSPDTEATVSEELDLWGAAAFNNQDQLEAHIERGIDLDQKNQDGSTALHIAAFFGHAESAEILLDAGADPEIKNREGFIAAELLFVDWGLTKYIADLVKVPINQEDLDQGREEIAAMLAERSESPVDLAAGKQGERPPTEQSSGLGGLISFLMYFPLFGHLWFLWFLCWFVISFVIIVKLAQMIGVKQLPEKFATSFWRYLWVIPLTALPQFFMGETINSFGPDTSIGLIPIPAVFCYYAIFFSFGAIYFDSHDNEVTVGRGWWFMLPLSLIVLFPVGLWFGSGDTGIQMNGFTKIIFALIQVSYAWLMTFGFMGLFHRFYKTESQTMRYLSDSSYWLYLAHIPLIMYVQFLIRNWQFPAVLKFLVVCIVTSTTLLITYQYCIRYTPLGTLLNGTRRKTRVDSTLEAVTQSGS